MSLNCSDIQFRKAFFVPLCFFCHFLAQYSSESQCLGVFRNPQNLLLMMGTEILKIDTEMAEKIEVEVGTFNTEIIFLPFCHFPNEGCQLHFNFLSHFCIDYQNLSAHHQEEILRIPKHPQKTTF